MKRHLLLIALLATSAHADVWTHAIDPDAGVDMYDSLMTKGDDAALEANSMSISLAEMRKHIDVSIEAYRAAAKVRPTSGEPWFRIGAVLYSFFFDDCDVRQRLQAPVKTCQIRGPERQKKSEELIEAWDKFESLSPLDPRINDMLSQRAILRTKLVNSAPNSKPLLEAAAKDYQAVIDREDGVVLARSAGFSRILAVGNLAETYMMLGDIDKAIKAYIVAMKLGARASTLYGLAVALDRDERSSEALQLIRSLGLENYREFQNEFSSNQIFFVPSGEEEYYFALCDEAFGSGDTAIDHWKAFITSGAHKQFQPRAKEHLDRLLARKNLRWKVPLAPDPDGREPLIKKNPFTP